MKNSLTPIICVLICHLPALLTGQVIQDQNQKLMTGASLKALQSNSNRSMPVSPLLRISNIGSSGQDGVSIELNDLTLMNQGPSLLFDFPALGSTSGNSMRIQPNSGKSYIKVSNIGSSGQDGVSLRVNSQCCLDSFFDISYNLKTGIENHRYGITGDPDFDLLSIRTYDRATPKLSERIASSNPALVNSFFDISYDLAAKTSKVSFQDFHFARTFDASTPKLQEHMSSGNPVMNSFFDVFYDLSLGKETHVHGDPDFDLLVSRTYDKNLRRLKDSIYSHNLMTNSFFDIEYDLGLGTETHVHGDPDFDLLVTRTFDKATPKLQEKIYSRILEEEGIYYYTQNLHTGEQLSQYCDTNYIVGASRIFDTSTPKLSEKISSTNPLGHGFFDISYDLNLARERRAFRVLQGDPDFDLIVVRNYDKATPKLQETISSSNPALVNSFFDVSYDLNAKQHKIKMEDLIVTSTFSSSTPKYGQKIASSLLPYIDNFFDISYDLNAKLYKIMLEDLIVSTYYYPATPKIQNRISSTNPLYENSFFDITYDLASGTQKTQYKGLSWTINSSEPSTICWNVSSSLPAVPGYFDVCHNIGLANLQTISTKAGAPGTPALEQRYEYDASGRKIRQVSTDLNNGATLTVEHRLLPAGSSLFVSNKMEIQGALEVQGSVSTPGGGPLTISDNVIINGAAHQIIGNTQVIGNLTVNGMFSSTNKFFKIDHPLDPDHKYLIHSCVESPDMMNVYNGNAVTDEQGYVTIALPDYFEALNTDFRYQLTCMGQFAQAIIAEKIKDNKFVIRTDKPNVEVSWQVTGIRNDPASNRKTYTVEIEKEPEMEGKRLYHQ